MPSPSITLRPATPADAPALAALGRDSFVAKFGQLYSAQDLAAFLGASHTEAVVSENLANPARRYMLAVGEGGALLGYCQLSLACGWPEHARGARPVELKQLYTAPGATGQGIGAALMDWVLAEARAAGADEMQLSVYSENAGAQAFYTRYGFAHVADITFAVGGQIDHEFLFAAPL